MFLLSAEHFQDNFSIISILQCFMIPKNFSQLYLIINNSEKTTFSQYVKNLWDPMKML